jgi:hypothetical protein
VLARDNRPRTRTAENASNPGYSTPYQRNPEDSLVRCGRAVRHRLCGTMIPHSDSIWAWLTWCGQALFAQTRKNILLELIF